MQYIWLFIFHCHFFLLLRSTEQFIWVTPHLWSSANTIYYSFGCRI